MAFGVIMALMRLLVTMLHRRYRGYACWFATRHGYGHHRVITLIIVGR